MSTVALIRCESYQYKAVKESIERGLSFLGGISVFVQKGEKILLKLPGLMHRSYAIISTSWLARLLAERYGDKARRYSSFTEKASVWW